MYDCSAIKECKYSGVLAQLCENFINEKRAVGYLYNREAKALSEFSRFSEKFDIPLNTLTEEVVNAWIDKKPTDSSRNHYARFSLIKQFSEYMQRIGCSVYCPKRKEIGKLHHTFVPYIFTHEEIKRFFEAADSMTYSPIAPRRHLVMPVMFRMLYCCGLRVSEATELRGEDVDLNEGVLIILNSKFGKTRYVPMSVELTNVCTKYAETRLISKLGDDWFFAAPDGGHYSRNEIYYVFRDILWRAGISHGGRGKGPRVHDFRHTFSVHCLQKWVKQGVDPTNVLPRLTAYLGHAGFVATERYLRMTADIYPEIAELMQEKYGYVIPRQEDTLV